MLNFYHRNFLFIISLEADEISKWLAVPYMGSGSFANGGRVSIGVKSDPIFLHQEHLKDAFPAGRCNWVG